MVVFKLTIVQIHISATFWSIVFFIDLLYFLVQNKENFSQLENYENKKSVWLIVLQVFTKRK
jgi:hypothetical protein